VSKFVKTDITRCTHSRSVTASRARPIRPQWADADIFALLEPLVKRHCNECQTKPPYKKRE